jgi:hypothetical protein
MERARIRIRGFHQHGRSEEGSGKGRHRFGGKKLGGAGCKGGGDRQLKRRIASLKEGDRFFFVLFLFTNEQLKTSFCISSFIFSLFFFSFLFF